MKKLTLISIFTVAACLSVSANNIENIYGKNDRNFNSRYGTGAMIQYDKLAPRYIDIVYAEKEIETLSSDNDTFEKEIESYRSGRDSYTVQQSEINQLLVKIGNLLVDLKATSAELYSLKSSQADKEMRLKLQTSIEQNRQQIYDLNNKKSDLISNLEELDHKIEVAERFELLNTLFISRNNSRIQYYENCIAFSNQDKSALERAVEKTDSFQNEVDDLLNVSF